MFDRQQIEQLIRTLQDDNYHMRKELAAMRDRLIRLEERKDGGIEPELNSLRIQVALQQQENDILIKRIKEITHQIKTIETNGGDGFEKNLKQRFKEWDAIIDDVRFHAEAEKNRLIIMVKEQMERQERRIETLSSRVEKLSGQLAQDDTPDLVTAFEQLRMSQQREISYSHTLFTKNNERLEKLEEQLTSLEKLVETKLLDFKQELRDMRNRTLGKADPLIWYLDHPLPGGAIPIGSFKPQVRVGKTIYELRINPLDEAEARFYIFISPDVLRKAFGFPDQFVLPFFVVDPKLISLKIETNTVFTCKPALLRLKTNKWVVETKGQLLLN